MRERERVCLKLSKSAEASYRVRTWPYFIIQRYILTYMNVSLRTETEKKPK